MENNNQTQFNSKSPRENYPNNYLVWSILTTIFCCLPLGIVAIVKSASVDRLWAEGRHEEARRAADMAKKFSIWGAVISLVFSLIYLILRLFFG